MRTAGDDNLTDCVMLRNLIKVRAVPTGVRELNPRIIRS